MTTELNMMDQMRFDMGYPIKTERDDKRKPSITTKDGVNYYKEVFDKAVKTGKLKTRFDKVMKYTKFEGYTAAEEKKVKSAFENLYCNSSEQVREKFDKVANQKVVSHGNMPKPTTNAKGEVIFEIKHPKVLNKLLNKQCKDSQASPYTTTAYVDPNNKDNLYFTNQYGDKVILSLERILNHEATHAINYTDDNLGIGDPQGNTVRETNIGMTQMGSSDIRAGYKKGFGSIDGKWKDDGCKPPETEEHSK